MNNTFNAQRFGFLFRKTLLERPVQLIGAPGLIFALVGIIYFICKSIIGFGPAQNISFIWGLAGGGCFYASFMFNYFSSNAMGSSFLTLPVSALEKWIFAVLVAGIFYPLLFLIFFRTIDVGFVAWYHHGLDQGNPMYKRLYDDVFLFSLTGRIAIKVYSLFLLLSGVALYFNKVSFLKTAIAFCLVMVAIFGLNWLMAKLMFGQINDAAPFNHVSVPMGKEEGSIELPENWYKVSFVTLDWIIPVIFWTLTYIRLREKEF